MLCLVVAWDRLCILESNCELSYIRICYIAKSVMILHPNKNTTTRHNFCHILLFLLTVNTKFHFINYLLKSLTVANLFVWKTFINIHNQKSNWPPLFSWLYQSLFKYSFLHYCKYMFRNRETTVHGYNLARIARISTHLEHQSYSLSTVIKFFESKLCSPVFSINKLKTKHFWWPIDMSPSQFVWYSFWMWLPWNRYPAWTIFVQTINHVFINT